MPLKSHAVSSSTRPLIVMKNNKKLRRNKGIATGFITLHHLGTSLLTSFFICPIVTPGKTCYITHLRYLVLICDKKKKNKMHTLLTALSVLAEEPEI